MAKSKVFNRGIAAGDAFCNRVEELHRLAKNIEDITHTLLISPRRYGKTSLALRAIEASKLPYAYIDLFMKYDEASINHEFFAAISALLTKIMKPTEVVLRKLESVFKNLSVTIKLGDFGLEFALAPKNNDMKSLKSLLMNIDDILSKNNVHTIIFIDEMQSITETPLSNEIESALRFVAQKTNNISFIFSGSNRRLLEKIFDDRSRPLYKLCHKISLGRIGEEHYQKFINKFAKIKWKESIPNETIETICSCAKIHPYYMNILCSSVFELEHVPKSEDVIQCWEKICEEEQGSVASDMEFLTPKQKHLLNEIARTPNLKEPTSKDFVKKVDLTPKGILGAIEILLKHDIIERLKTREIRIVDKEGDTIDFMLLKNRDEKAAQKFLKKTLHSSGIPDKITIDKSGANKPGINAINLQLIIFYLLGYTLMQINIRQIKYLNNIIEQDHRGIKRIVNPMMGFKSFYSAQATLAGIELY